MITENEEEAQKKGLKKFVISGHVQVEVFATIYAKDLKTALKGIAENDKKYGKGNGVMYNYEEGNWCSEVEIEKVEES